MTEQEITEDYDLALHDKAGGCLTLLITAVNSMTDEELGILLRDIGRETAIGPLLDPTAWSYGGKIREFEGMRKVLTALRTFKREVAGIGRFAQ